MVGSATMFYRPLIYLYNKKHNKLFSNSEKYKKKYYHGHEEKHNILYGSSHHMVKGLPPLLISTYTLKKKKREKYLGNMSRLSYKQTRIKADKKLGATSIIDEIITQMEKLCDAAGTV